MLRRFLSSLTAEAPSLAEHEAPRLGRMTGELTRATLAQHLNAYDRLPHAARNRVLLARIDTFIEDHLGDPALTPAAIAAHHNISLRTLHWLFRNRDLTVAATVRQQRLERCRADLAVPGQVSVQAVAARWGFASPAAFSRCFRSAYGTTATPTWVTKSSATAP